MLKTSLSTSLYVFLILLNFTSIASLKIDWYGVKPVNCSGKNIVEADSVINLNIMLHINAIYEISEEKMEFGMQVHLTEIRENFELNLTGIKSDDTVSKLIPDHVIECLWQPDTIFRNAKYSYLYEDTLPNRFFKLVFPYEFIIRSSRYKIIASCDMDFHLFPMDSQRCSLDISLLANRGNEVVLSWMDSHAGSNLNPVNFINKVKPLNFQINLINATSTKIKSSDNSISQYLHANFSFVRSLTASIVNAYIPSFLTVCLSMVSFWLDVNAVPGRVTLGVTAILTLFTEIVHIRSSLPTLDYMTAMDVWLLGCVIMVFLSLLEFTLAQSLSRQAAIMESANQDCKEYSEKQSIPLAWPQTFNDSPQACNDRPQTLNDRPQARKVKPKVTSESQLNKLNPKRIMFRKNGAKRDNTLDRMSRFAFPLVMTCFTSVYWLYFYNEAYP